MMLSWWRLRRTCRGRLCAVLASKPRCSHILPHVTSLSSQHLRGAGDAIGSPFQSLYPDMRVVRAVPRVSECVGIPHMMQRNIYRYFVEMNEKTAVAGLCRVHLSKLRHLPDCPQTADLLDAICAHQSQVQDAAGFGLVAVEDAKKGYQVLLQ